MKRALLRKALLGLAVAWAAAPLLVLIVWSVAFGWYWPAVLPRQWSLRAWRYVAAPESGLAEALGVSLAIAVVVTVLALSISVPAGRTLALGHRRARTGLLFLMLLPVLAPPMASAMGLHMLFVRMGLAGTMLGIVLVHLIPAVPYATLTMMGSFSRFDRDLEEQARTLGAGWAEVWRHVTLPAVAPGIAIAGAFAFLISWSQYLLTLLIGGGDVRTLPLALVAFARSGDEAVTAALGLVFVAPALLLFVGIARHLRDNA